MAGLRTFRPLRQREFRKLFASQAMSGLGDWLDFVALLTLVAYHWKSGAFGLAALAIAMAAPWVVVAPFAGVWADRLPIRAALVGSDVLRAVCVLGYLLAEDLSVLLLLVVAKGSMSTLFAAAERKAVRQASTENDLHAAVSLTTFTGQAAKVVGPAAGGLLVAAVGPHGAFVADAVTFLLSAMVLSGLRLPPVATEGQPATERGRFWLDFREGMSYLAHSRPLRAAVTGLAATIFLVFAFDTLSPLTLQLLGVGEAMLGPAIACVGLGAVAGTVLLGQWGERFRPMALMGASQTVAGLLVVLMGIAVLTRMRMPAAAWLPVMIAIGAAAAGILMSFALTLQRETPESMLGRVSGAAGVLPTVMQFLAPMVGAAFAATVGIGWVLAVAGGCLAALGVLIVGPFARAPADGAAKGFLGAFAAPEPDVVAHASLVPPVDVGLRTRSPEPSVIL
jgi:MFS family permease